MAGTRVPAKEIGLPSDGAIVESAVNHPAEADLPATCRVIGKIRSISAGSPPIRFEVNLPREWNHKALQFGGGGFDGVLVDGLNNMPGNAAVSKPALNPLARGYATFGSDGGHEGTMQSGSAFGRDPQALANYAGEAVKRTHDGALAIMRRFYGTGPARTYFAGGSKGGHEGLVAVQRYGADYDGVISFYPAKDLVALVLAWGALSQAAYGTPGGAPRLAKQSYLKNALLGHCDALDGLRDGVIANTRACLASISPETFACAEGTLDDTQCLNVAERRTFNLSLQRQPLPIKLENGVDAFGPFPVFNGASFEGIWFSPKGPNATAYGAFVNGVIRDFWTRDNKTTFETLDIARFRTTILDYSRISDATSTDLDAFAGHGGKLILVQGMTDMLVPPAATTDYYLRIAARYGSKAPDFVKYFQQPSYGHGAGDFDLQWDSLAALDHWVETGVFSDDQVATDGNPATRDRQMPLCQYPKFPRYLGGDSNMATSFSCMTQ